MNSFTKFLIVLLTVCSLFLCGIVLTYVLTADNWKEQYQSRENALSEMKRTLTQKQNQFDAEKGSLQAQYDSLMLENKDLKGLVSQSEVELGQAKRDSLALNQRVSDATGVIEGLQQTVEGLRTSLEVTSQELNEKRSEVAVMSKKLNEISAALDEKIVELDAMNVENKRLVEVKSELEKMVGSDITSVQPVTAAKSAVSVTAPAYLADGINLKALVSEVDMSNNLATITIGSADGIQKGMRFHITRGSDFICDVIITNVDTENSAGVLELVQSAPKIGDNVSSML